MIGYEAVFSALKNVRRHPRKPDLWRCCCPVHDDTAPSAFVGLGEAGRLIIHCSVCRRRDRGWLELVRRATGTVVQDWYPPHERRGERRRPRMAWEVVCAYPYRDKAGRTVVECLRVDGWHSKCAYRRPANEFDDPKRVREDRDGRWVYDGAGLDLDKLELGEIVPAGPMLYRLPEFLAADPRQPVFVCEGERDCETLAELGYVATTNSHGAGNFVDSLAVPFEGRRAVILQDHDGAGRDFSARVSGLLLTHGAASVRVVTFRDLPEHGDLTDWLDARFPLDGGHPRGRRKPLNRPREQWRAERQAVAEYVRGFPEWRPATVAAAAA